MMTHTGNEGALVQFIVMNLTNLVCALAWASASAIDPVRPVIAQARDMLTAILDRAEKQNHNAAAR